MNTKEVDCMKHEVISCCCYTAPCFWTKENVLQWFCFVCIRFPSISTWKFHRVPLATSTSLDLSHNLYKSYSLKRCTIIFQRSHSLIKTAMNKWKNPCSSVRPTRDFCMISPWRRWDDIKVSKLCSSLSFSSGSAWWNRSFFPTIAPPPQLEVLKKLPFKNSRMSLPWHASFDIPVTKMQVLAATI